MQAMIERTMYQRFGDCFFFSGKASQQHLKHLCHCSVPIPTIRCSELHCSAGVGAVHWCSCAVQAPLGPDSGGPEELCKAIRKVQQI